MSKKLLLLFVIVAVFGKPCFSQQVTPTPQPYKWVLVKTGDNLHSNKDRSLWNEADRNEDMRASFKQGYMIERRNSVRGVMERDFKRFVLIRTLTKNWNPDWVKPEYDKDGKITLLRKYRIPLEKILSVDDIGFLQSKASDYARGVRNKQVQPRDFIIIDDLSPLVEENNYFNKQTKRSLIRELKTHGSSGTFIIDSGGGGDYTTVSAWETGEQADLTGTGACIGRITSAFNETTSGKQFDGWTTTASDPIILEATGAALHPGYWDETKFYWSSTDNYCALVVEDYVQFDGLQMEVINPTAARTILDILIVGASNNIQVRNCIFKGHNDVTYSQNGIYAEDADTILYLYNTVFWNFGTLSNTNLVRFSGNEFYGYNNTLSGGEVGFYNNGGTSVISVNGLFTGQTYACFGTFAAGTDYNATSNSTMQYSVTGSGNTHDRVSQTFTFTDAGNGDFHLGSGDTGALDFGVSDPGSGLFTDDFEDDVRSGSWDIGADEYDAGGATPTPTATSTNTPTATSTPVPGAINAIMRILNVTSEYIDTSAISVEIGSEVYFDSGQSTSTAGVIHNTSTTSAVIQPIVLWDFGDGYKMDSTNYGTVSWNKPNWSTEMVTHFYMTAGVYDASMTIWDATGNIDQTFCEITVTGETPMTGYKVLRADLGGAFESQNIHVIVPSSQVGSATKLHVTLSNNRGDFQRTLVDHRTISSTTETFVLYGYTLPEDEYYIEYSILNNEDVVSTGGYIKERFKKWHDGKSRISIDKDGNIFKNGEGWYSVSEYLQNQITMFWYGQNAKTINTLISQQGMTNGWGYEDWLSYLQSASTIPLEGMGPIRWEGNSSAPGTGQPLNYWNPNTAQAIITAASRTNNMAAWTWADEPTLPYGSGLFPIVSMQYRAANFLVNFYDGMTPTLLNHYGMNYLSTYASSRDNVYWDFMTNAPVFGKNVVISDIGMTDRYVDELGGHSAFSDPNRSSIDLDLEALHRYHDMYEHNLSAFYAYIEADDFQRGDGEGVIPERIKNIAWLHVIHGVKGLNWFILDLTEYLPNTAWTYETNRAKNELERWQVPIMSWSDAQPVFSDAVTRADRVDAKAWREGNNINIVAARVQAATFDPEYATYPEPANVNAGLTIYGLDGIYAVNVLDETRTITMSAPGVFNDDFGNNEYHFYQIVVDATEAAGIPQIISMTTGTVTSDLTPTFTWSASGTVTISTYEIQIAEDVNFGTGVINDASITATSYTPPFSLTDGSSYFWRVRAHAQDYYHFSEWSDAAQFSVNASNPQGTIYISGIDGDDTSASPFTPETAWRSFAPIAQSPLISNGTTFAIQGIVRGKFNAPVINNVTLTSYGIGGEIRGSSDVTLWGEWHQNPTYPNVYSLVDSGSSTPTITTVTAAFFNSDNWGIENGRIGQEYAWWYGNTIGGVTQYEDFETDVNTGYWDTNTGTVSSATQSHGSNSYQLVNQKLRKNDNAFPSLHLRWDLNVTSAGSDVDTNRTQIVNVLNNADWSSTALRVTGYNSGGTFYIGLDFGNSYLATYPLARDTWYRIDLTVNPIADTATLLVDNAVADSVSTVGMSNNIDDFEIGSMNLESANFTIYIDHLFVGDGEWVRLPWDTLSVHSLAGDPDVSGVSIEAVINPDDTVSIYDTEQDYYIHDITIKHAGRHGINGFDSRGGHLIENVTLEFNKRHGIILSGTDLLSGLSTNNIIQLSTAAFNGEMGFSYGAYVTNSTIENNVAYNNGHSEEPDTAGIRIVPGVAAAWQENKDIWIISNTVYNTGKDATGTTDVGNPDGLIAGIWMDTIRESTAMFNVVYNNKGAGIYPECASQTLTDHNLVYNNDFGIRLDTGKAAPIGSFNNKITNNTLYNNAIGILNAGKSDDDTRTGNNYFANNIVTGDGDELDLYLRYGGENVVITNNAFSVESTAFMQLDATTYDTYDAFETAFGSSLNSIETDPALSNPIVSFLLDVESPVIDQGVTHTWESSVDIGNDPIIPPIDYGAYENQIPTLTPTPTPGGGDPIMFERIMGRRRGNQGGGW